MGTNARCTFGTAILTSPKVFYSFNWRNLNWFCSRYAGGCTSGHAISGLSNLQIESRDWFYWRTDNGAFFIATDFVKQN
jgi:hypothetical protein